MAAEAQVVTFRPEMRTVDLVAVLTDDAALGHSTHLEGRPLVRLLAYLTIGIIEVRLEQLGIEEIIDVRFRAESRRNVYPPAVATSAGGHPVSSNPTVGAARVRIALFAGNVCCARAVARLAPYPGFVPLARICVRLGIVALHVSRCVTGETLRVRCHAGAHPVRPVARGYGLLQQV